MPAIIYQIKVGKKMCFKVLNSEVKLSPSGNNSKTLELQNLIFNSLQFQISNRRNDQREFFNCYIRYVQAKAFFFGKTMFFEPEVKFHYYPLYERQFIILAKVFFHNHKLEV